MIGRVSALRSGNAEISLLEKGLFPLGGEFVEQKFDGPTAHKNAVVHEGPVCDFVGIDGYAVAHLDPSHLPGLVVHLTMEAATSEGNVGQPEMFNNAIADEGLFHLEVALGFLWVLQRSNEDVYCFSCFLHGARHFGVTGLNLKAFGFNTRSDHVPAESVGVGLIGAACTQQGKQKDKFQFHRFLGI